MSSAEQFDGLDVIAISECKAHFLRLADQVARTGQPLVVTRHGKPVVRIEPIAEAAPPSLIGSLEQLCSDEELVAPIPVTWNAVA